MFSTLAVLSAQSGMMLVKDMQEVVELAEHIIGRQGFTQQMLPPLHQIMQGVLEEQYPWLVDVEFKLEHGQEKMIRKAGLLIAHFGETLEVESMSDAMRRRVRSGFAGG